MTISASMIVKNESLFLEECLESIKDVVDEIIIVDTGSTDNTKEIAKKYTQKVYDFEWSGDFSKARNYALSKATSDWVLSIDADEKISVVDKKKLLELTNNNEVDAYYLKWRDYSNSEGTQGWKSNKNDNYKENKGFLGFTETPVLRLFKNNRSYKFVGTIHETIAESIKNNNGIIYDCDLVIHHYGHLRTKEEQDYAKMLKERITKKDFNDEEEYFILYEIGRELTIKNNLEEAKKYFELSIEKNPDYAPSLSSLGAIHINFGDINKAESLIKKSLIINGNDDSAHANLGVIYSKKGEYNKSLRKFERAIEINDQSADHYYNLGVIYEKMKKSSKAKDFYDKAIELNPNYKKIIV
ncbi:MAG: glycosyltransferase [Nanoarchaeota archaeon]